MERQTERHGGLETGREWGTEKQREERQVVQVRETKSETCRLRKRERLGDRESEGGETSRAAEIERQPLRERLGDIESE